jgi:hypothetical protein
MKKEDEEEKENEGGGQEEGGEGRLTSNLAVTLVVLVVERW